MRRGACLLLLILASLSPARADEAEDRSAAFVKKIGGRFYRAEGKPGKPVYKVDLTFSKITDAGLKELAGFQQLRTLEIHDNPVGDAGLPDLKRLTQLEKLHLSYTGVSKAGLA